MVLRPGGPLRDARPHTRPDDWACLHAAETVNPAGEERIPGPQMDGYFPNTSTSDAGRAA